MRKPAGTFLVARLRGEPIGCGGLKFHGERPAEIIVSVAADGRYAVNRQAVEGRNVDKLSAALQAAAKDQKDPVVIVSADATAAHQSVINVLDAARRAGLPRLTFAAQTGDGSAPR